MQFTYIILAGGKSTRMKQDKGLMLINEKPLIAHVIQNIEKQSRNILISTNNEAYQQFEYPIVKDRETDIGPMGGIYSCLEQVKTKGVVLLTCDMPMVKATFTQKLIVQLDEVEAVVPKDELHVYPTCAAYKTEALKLAVEDCVKNRVYKLKMLLDTLHVHYYSVSEEESKYLVNLNTPEDVLSLLNQ